VSHDQEIAKKLLQLVDLSLDKEQLVAAVQECAVWPDECVTAFIHAWRKMKQSSPADQSNWFQEFQKARLWLPLTKIEKLDLLDHLARLEIEIIARQKMRFEYRPVSDWPKPPQTATVPTRTFPFLARDPLNGINPFPHRDAHDDRYNLFTLREKPNRAFWGGHPTFNRLFRLEQSALVEGYSGSGRTALAYGLHYYATQRNFWAFYITGQPKLDDIKLRFVEHLFDFFLNHPPYLRRLSVAQRNLAAHFLASIISVEVLLSRIDEKRKALDPFSQQFDKQQEAEEISNQLQLLANALTRGSITGQNSSKMAWVSQISSIVNALDFERIMLVLDCDNHVDWLQEHILPHIIEWQTRGMLTILFIPDGILDHSAIPCDITRMRLDWTKEQLKKMIRWRYKAFAGERREILELFNEDDAEKTLDHLLFHCMQENTTPHLYNPGKFFSLWPEIIAPLSSMDLIIKSHIMDALDNFDRPEHILDSTDTIAERKTHETATAKQSVLLEPRQGLYTKQELYRALVEYFDNSELEKLCFELDVEAESVFTGGNKEGFARKIISYFERRGRLLELQQKIEQERPHSLPPL
jgi:hypothetical protein